MDEAPFCRRAQPVTTTAAITPIEQSTCILLMRRPLCGGLIRSLRAMAVADHRYCDQDGEKLLPSVVICRASLPSRAMVKTCVRPFREVVNARWRPLGAKVGRSLDPAPDVIWRTLPVLSSSTLISVCDDVPPAKAISFSDADHVACSA